MVETLENRQKCIRNLLTIINNYKADGVDLDWEYPGQRGGAAADKVGISLQQTIYFADFQTANLIINIFFLQRFQENFIKFIKELQEEFKPRGLLLTAAVGGPAHNIPVSYDVPKMTM